MTVRRPGVEIGAYVDGDGPALVILPSYGRDGGEDFDDITARAVQAGWQVLRPQPRGVAGSNGAWFKTGSHVKLGWRSQDG